MIELTNFELHKLYGYIYSLCDKYEYSLRQFETALIDCEDGQIYFQMAYCYCYLKEYKTAKDYALKAIALGYDAYELYTRIMVGNLADVNSAIPVLKEGAEKGNASACLELSYLYLENNLEPDMINPYECITYMEKAFTCAKPSEKSGMSYAIYKRYQLLERRYPYLNRNRSVHYLKIFNEYGGAFAPARCLHITLFNECVACGDNSVIQLLFDRFDLESKIIFTFMLLEKQYKKTGNNSIDKASIVYLLINHLANKERNQIGKMLLAYIDYSSSEKMKHIAKNARNTYYFIPDCYKEPFDLFLNSYIDIMSDNAKA